MSSIKEQKEIVGWWEKDEELKEIAKIDSERVCYCMDEGSEEYSYYICPEHPPKSLTHMRALIKMAMKIAYVRGKDDACEKLQKSLKDILLNDTNDDR